MATLEFKPVPDEEAIRAFERKGFRFGFDWRDTVAAQHANQFTVAKAMRLDILADIREAVDAALRDGVTLEEFQRRLKPLLVDKGWWGRKEMADPKTGEVHEVRLGSPRRLRTIYDTNLRTAHAAGRWRRIMASKDRRPYLRYVAVLDGRTRDEHKAWHGVVLRWDDPWWTTHYPPNGWFCRCIVQQLSERDLRRWNHEVSKAAPADQEVAWHDRRNEVTHMIPKGIDPGFAHNVGQLTRTFELETAKTLPVLEQTPTFRDYGRPPAAQVRERPPAPERGPMLSDLVGEGVPEAEARRMIETEFRKTFGIAAGATEASVRDHEGMNVVFNTGFLNYLLGKSDGREAFMPFVPETLRDPFEVWLVPVRKANGRVVMRKRYIKLFEGPPDRDFLLVVDRYREGWGAWTAHPRDTIDTQRKGYLLWAQGSSQDEA